MSDFDRGNADYNASKDKDPAEGLLRTLGTACIVSSLISALGTFYVLFSSSSALVYWLSFMVPYGALVVAALFLGFFAIFQKERPLYRLIAILGMAYGALLCLSFIPNGVFLHNWKIAIAIGVIGACVFAIALLTYLQLKEKKE